MTRDAFIYALADVNGIRYVGRTVNLAQRMISHRGGWDGSRTRLFDVSASRLLVLEATTSDEAKAREQFWITSLSKAHPLLNVMGNPDTERRGELLPADRSYQPDRCAFVVRLPLDLVADLDRAAKAEDRTKRSVVERAIRRYLELPA